MAKKEAKQEDPTLDMVMSRFNAARSYTRKGFWDTWADCRSLYNSQRIAVNYEGSSDTFVPETFTIIQSVKSNVIGGKIKIDFLPTDSEQTGDVRVLNSLMDQIWTQDKTKLKASWAIEDALEVGNGYLWQYWDGKIPCNRYVPTEDNFFDPDATNYNDLRYGGYCYLTTKKDLTEEKKTNLDYDENDPKSEKKINKYKNLDQLDDYKKTYKPDNDKFAKQLREEMVAGSVLEGEKEDVVEVICYMDKKKLIKIANRCAVIEEIDTPFQRKASVIQSVDDMGRPVPVEIPEIPAFIPVAPARDYVDGALWYAKGEVEVIGDLQELLNDTQNQKTDNLSYTLNRMWTLDPSQAHKIDEIQSMPGAVFTVPPGSLEQITNQSIGVDADNEMARLQGMMRRATAADELVQGSKPVGDPTATEINAQLAQAGTRFGSKLENFESEFFHILAENMFKIMQIFLTQEQAVRMIGQEGVEWKNYNPGEFLGDYDVKVQLDGTARVLKEEEKQSAMQFYLMASKMPFVDQQLLFKMTATKLFDLDRQELDKLVQPIPTVPIGPDGQPLPPGTLPPGPAGGAAAPSVGNAPGMPQQGQGAIASAPQAPAENAVSANAQQAVGLNVPGMPT